jgi:hypothetical protein
MHSRTPRSYFNYDRTVEHYLYWALQQLGISTTEAAEGVARLKIIRPYGSIGQLEWQGRSGLSFGGNNNPIVASEIANNIRTFTEQIQEETVHSSIEEALENAIIVVYLGFGFHQQNLRLLKPPTSRVWRPVHLLIATTFGMDERNYPAITDYLHSELRISPSSSILNPWKAAELLEKLRTTISMAAA